MNVGILPLLLEVDLIDPRFPASLPSGFASASPGITARRVLCDPTRLLRQGRQKVWVVARSSKGSSFEHRELDSFAQELRLFAGTTYNDMLAQTPSEQAEILGASDS